MTNKMDRKNFFQKIGFGVMLAAISTSLPAKLFSSIAKSSLSKKVNIKIHPSAVKRNDKV